MTIPQTWDMGMERGITPFSIVLLPSFDGEFQSEEKLPDRGARFFLQIDNTGQDRSILH